MEIIEENSKEEIKPKISKSSFNELCLKCKEDCKQFDFIKINRCPIFKPKKQIQNKLDI